jgi:Zn-dependent protease with chaperone function
MSHPAVSVIPMEIAALLVALAASVFAGLAWWQARRSATQAQRVADIDAARRHDERAPKFTARFGYAQGLEQQQRPLPAVWFDYLAGPGELFDLAVRLVRRSDARPTPILAIGPMTDLDSEQWGTSTALFTPMVVGQERLVLVALDERGLGNEAAFVVSCAAAEGEQWQVPVRCNVPQQVAPPNVIVR